MPEKEKILSLPGLATRIADIVKHDCSVGSGLVLERAVKQPTKDNTIQLPSGGSQKAAMRWATTRRKEHEEKKEKIIINMLSSGSDDDERTNGKDICLSLAVLSIVFYQ